jgi:hypothetical protein
MMTAIFKRLQPIGIGSYLHHLYHSHVVLCQSHHSSNSYIKEAKHNGLYTHSFKYGLKALPAYVKNQYMNIETAQNEKRFAFILTAAKPRPTVASYHECPRTCIIQDNIKI